MKLRPLDRDSKFFGSRHDAGTPWTVAVAGLRDTAAVDRRIDMVTAAQTWSTLVSALTPLITRVCAPNKVGLDYAALAEDLTRWPCEPEAVRTDWIRSYGRAAFRPR